MERITPSHYTRVALPDGGSRPATLGDKLTLEFLDAMNQVRLAAELCDCRQNAAIRRASRQIAKRTDTREIKAILLDMAARKSPINRFNELMEKVESAAGGYVSLGESHGL